MYKLSTTILALACAMALTAATASPAGAPRYRVTVLDPLSSGASSAGRSVNNLGWVTGYSATAAGARHATLWAYGLSLDLGALGGAGSNSAVLWPVKNMLGRVTGISQTGTPDDSHEDWSCSYFIGSNGHTCVGFVWDWGKLHALPTLGGNNGFATGANNRGQIVGWAENKVVDTVHCVAPQKYRFLPVVWGPDGYNVHALPLVNGDDSGAATALNDRGQVVGISGECGIAVGSVTARHAVLWEHGRITRLGNLGAAYWNTPMAISPDGAVVVGFAGQPNDPDGNFTIAFRWTARTGMQNLHVLHPDDVSSSANAVNARGQIAGSSCDAQGNCRAFLWQNGAMMDLNDAASRPGFVLTSAQDINDLGQITGRAVARDKPAGPGYSYIATPIR